MKQNQILVTVLVAILFAGAGFFGGMSYQKSKPVTFNRGQFGDVAGRIGMGQNGGQPGGNRVRIGGGQILGDIIASDDKSITVKLADGSSKIVLVTSATNINKAATASIADFKVGEKVSAFGITNTDGSVTAQNIQLNPIARGPMPSISVTPTK